MKWEYNVVHINVDDNPNDNGEVSNPDEASKKLKGSLSPDFLKDQFPDQYQENDKSEHPAVQLRNFLNKKGLEQWEVFDSLRIGNMLFLIMKRQVK